jgi:hypothetical protein
LSADGSRLATVAAFVSNESRPQNNVVEPVRLWDVRVSRQMLEFKGHADKVWSMTLSPDGTRLVTAAADGVARLWDVRTGLTLHEFKGYNRELMRGVAFSTDGACLAFLNDSGEPNAVWDAGTGQPVSNRAGWPAQFAENTNRPPDGTFLYVPSGNRVLRLPTTIDEEERLMALLKTRPDPDWNAEWQRWFALRKIDHAVALHRSFEQQARGVVAFDFNQWDKAYWHFVAAALLKPPVPKAPEITSPLKK